MKQIFGLANISILDSYDDRSGCDGTVRLLPHRKTASIAAVLGALGVVCDENPNVIMEWHLLTVWARFSVGPLAGSVASLTFSVPLTLPIFFQMSALSVASVLYEADLTPDLVRRLHADRNLHRSGFQLSNSMDYSSVRSNRSSSAS